MSTLAKNHKDSVNVPIVLKQSSFLKAVPASQLQGQTHQSDHSTGSFTTASSAGTITVEITSEAPSRPSSPRLRGHRLRANATPRPSTSTTVDQPSTVAEEKPQQSIRRPHLRDSSRRVPARRPGQESTTAENIPEQQPAASPIIEQHARPLPTRPRFPPRTGAGHSTTTAAAPASGVVSDSPPQPVVTVSAAELNSLEDNKSKDSHIRAKSANDLFAFARLQQAISSRAPSRIPPKLVAGFVNSGKVTTDAITSSEVTTVSSFGGQSSESVGVSSDAPSTTTTTTTTTEAVTLDKYGRPRGRFSGRNRRPLGGAGASSASTTTTEAPATQRNRFTGGRRRTSTTEAPEGAAQHSTVSANNDEAQKPKLPQRNRFATRHRGSSTTETTPSNTDGQKPVESERPALAQSPRRRPGAGGFQSRRRPNQIQSQTEGSTAAQEETSSPASDAGSTAAASSTAAPALPGRNRFNFNAGAGRPRPGAGAQGPGGNPVRIRGGGRLRASTSSTTEAAPQEQPEAQEEHTDHEQSPTIQNEHVEQSLQTSPATEAPVVPQRGGLGRLKNRPKLVITTTLPPEGSGDRKHGRLNGLLGRRKNLGQLASAVHVKEEVKETISEVAEEANNHALEQTDDDHKGVVVQVSSSVTESEEVNEGHASEVLEPSSTTPGSILNRLKSQRKPGSLFRKKPDPHGE